MCNLIFIRLYRVRVEYSKPQIIIYGQATTSWVSVVGLHKDLLFQCRYII